MNQFICSLVGSSIQDLLDSFYVRLALIITLAIRVTIASLTKSLTTLASLEHDVIQKPWMGSMHGPVPAFFIASLRDVSCLQKGQYF